MIKYLKKTFKEYKHIFVNISWLFADRLLKMFLGLFIGVWVTRYLGPEAFGQWNYYSAYLFFFAIISTMGLESITTYMLIEHPENKNKILTSAFILRSLAGILAIGLSLLIAYCFKIFEADELKLILIMSLTFIIQPFEVLFSYFQSIFKPKYNAYSNLIAFVISSLMKIFLIWFGLGMPYFIYNSIAEVFLSMIILSLLFLSVDKDFFVKFDKEIFYSLCNKSLPLLFAGFIVSIYMRIDQFMIGKMLDNKAVGIYSAAVKIAEIWNFIPSVLISVLFIKILESKKNNIYKYEEASLRIYKLFTIIGITSSILTMLTASFTINLLYGKEYDQASEILLIYGGSIIFVFMGSINNSFLIADGLSKYIVYQTAIASILNILLNYVFILNAGINGSAIATFISYSFAAFFGNAVFKETRPYFRKQIHSLTKFYDFKRSIKK